MQFLSQRAEIVGKNQEGDFSAVEEGTHKDIGLIQS